MPIPLLLHGKHAGPTTVYEPFGPWIVPWRFDAFEEEWAALRRGVGLVDYSTQALIECRGPDRAEFLHRLLSHDIRRLAPGTGCRAALLTATAKLTADLLVLAGADAHWLLCDLTRAETVAQALERYHFAEHVSVANHERRYAVLAVQGPRAMELLASAAGDAPALAAPGDHVEVELAGLRLYRTVGSESLRVRVIRHSLTGGQGILCLVDAERADAAWDGLQRAGASVGLRLVGWEALNAARIEAGLPWYGIDMDDTTLLPETGLETVLASDAKGCYLGQEIIARMQTYGSPSKKLMGLVLEGRESASAGDRIVRNNEEVGRITSTCRSPALQRPLAMGYVKRGSYEPGIAVEILRGGTRLRATVAARPLIPHHQ